jgi:Trypsin-like peptidase domain
MTQFQSLADATLRIESGRSAGSGFHFIRPNIVVTNNHVVEGTGAPVAAITERGLRFPLRLLASSPTNQHDFAIFQVEGDVPADRNALRPKQMGPAVRGLAVVFSGFPHGIAHLLVHGAVISGAVSDTAFYLDGSVNGGNSGGPIIDRDDGRAIGIVTQRRFLGGPDLDTLRTQAEQIRTHCQTVAGQGTVSIMGIDFGGFSRLMAEGMLLMKSVLEANANAGIGIGFSIEFAAQRCAQLGIV